MYVILMLGQVHVHDLDATQIIIHGMTHGVVAPLELRVALANIPHPDFRPKRKLKIKVIYQSTYL